MLIINNHHILFNTTARAILLDLHSPMDSYTCRNIEDALSSTLRVIDHLQGIPRLTHMSLCVLGDYPEVHISL